MNFLAILISITLCSFKSQDDTGMLYITALKKHLSVNNLDSKSTIFLINEDIVDLPANINGSPIQLVGDSALSLLKNEPSFHAVKLHSIRIKNGNIIIPLSDYIVTKGSEGAIFSYGGGKEYIFSYSSSTIKYNIIQTKVISY